MKKLATAAAAAVACLAVLGLSAPAQAAPKPSAAENQESYWEALGYGDCTKVELPDGVSSFTLPPVSHPDWYTVLVLKAGSGDAANDVIYFPSEGVPYSHATGKNLSHVIYCVDAIGS
jgi:hypothetical protein